MFAAQVAIQVGGGGCSGRPRPRRAHDDYQMAWSILPVASANSFYLSTEFT